MAAMPLVGRVGTYMTMFGNFSSALLDIKVIYTDAPPHLIIHYQRHFFFLFLSHT